MDRKWENANKGTQTNGPEREGIRGEGFSPKRERERKTKI